MKKNKKSELKNLIEVTKRKERIKNEEYRKLPTRKMYFYGI